MLYPRRSPLMPLPLPFRLPLARRRPLLSWTECLAHGAAGFLVGSAVVALLYTVWG